MFYYLKFKRIQFLRCLYLLFFLSCTTKQDVHELEGKYISCFQNEDYRCALGYAKELFSIDPKDSLYKEGLAVCYSFANEPDSSKVLFEELVRDSRSNPTYYYGLGYALNQLGEYEEALNNLNIAIKLNPNFGNYYYDKCHSLLNLNRQGEVLDVLNEGIKRDSTCGSLYHARGLQKMYYYFDEDFCLDFEKGHQYGHTSEDDLKEYCNYKLLHHKSKLVRAAYLNYQRIQSDSSILKLDLELAQNPASKSDRDVLLLLARSHWYQHQYDLAVKYFAMVPLEEYVYYKHIWDYGYSLYQLERYQEAKKVFAEIPKEKLTWAILFSMGMCELNTGNNEGALAFYVRALAYNPYANELWLYKAQAEFNLGKSTQACQSLEKSVKLGFVGEVDTLFEKWCLTK